jgi:hypothetical protein
MKRMTNKHHLKNLGLEIVNVLAFLNAALKVWDKRMRKIVHGTFKRQIEVFLYKQKILKYVETHRNGNCAGCGVCCQYIRRCPYLTNDNRCDVNENKHLICKLYPISDYDVQLVSKVSDKKCGYHFRNEKE